MLSWLQAQPGWRRYSGARFLRTPERGLQKPVMWGYLDDANQSRCGFLPRIAEYAARLSGGLYVSGRLLQNR
jgi:hypothetical protein